MLSLPALRLSVLVLALAGYGGATAVDLEREARELEASLISPCCFSQQVSVHHSAAADEVRQDIRRRLRAGETQTQILDAYVARYGKRILAQPPAEGLGRVLHLMPPLGLLLTAVFVVAIVRRYTARRLGAPQMNGERTPPKSDGRYQDELDRQLSDLD
jgi:cytochrome c-type biogenesis protein CcmH